MAAMSNSRSGLVLAIVVVTIAMLAIVGVALVSGTNNTVTLGSLMGFLGLLITALINATLISNVSKKVDGHLKDHLEHLPPGHTDAQLQAIIKKVLEEQKKR